MGKVNRVVTSALVITGATALATAEAGATEQGSVDFLEQDMKTIEDELMEQALRSYTNPIKRIMNEMSQDHEHTFIYEVKEGDTLSGIAVAHEAKTSVIVKLNGIQNRHRLSIGQKLKIPLRERAYVVKHGDTLNNIAKENGVEIEDIMTYNQTINRTSSFLFPGQEIRLPSSPPEPVHQPVSTPRRLTNPKTNQVMIASRSQEETIEGGFIWPVSGTLTSHFGMRWGRPHNGIDISNSNRSHAQIVAAKSGVVTDAYFHRGGYGNLVVIEHGNGVKTYYAHLSNIKVAEGQKIAQGSVVGNMGQTGNATGYHLHFEIRIHNRPVNPLRYLPN